MVQQVQKGVRIVRLDRRHRLRVACVSFLRLFAAAILIVWSTCRMCVRVLPFEARIDSDCR
jgi:hypothetical protein